jgi:hypothetical protein
MGLSSLEDILGAERAHAADTADTGYAGGLDSEASRGTCGWRKNQLSPER